MRRGGRATLIAAPFCAGAVLLGLATTDCAEDLTEMVVVVDTDLAPGTDIDRIDVHVAGPRGDAGTTGANIGAEGPLPLTLGVDPGSALDALVTIVATGQRAKTAVARTTVQARMVKGRRQVVHVSLCKSCGLLCEENRADRFAEWTGTPPAKAECSAASGGDGGANDAGVACPADMALVANAGKPFCIDRTEVTQLAYKAFLDGTAGDAGGQPPECGFNDSYAAAADFQGSQCADPASYFTPDKTPKLPVFCVDWCDAYAYCGFVGKHLCGKIGGAPASAEDLFDEEGSEWFAACSNGGATVYPYGDVYNATLCNGADRVDGGQFILPVGEMRGCKTSDQVLDLLGNVAELEDSCEPAATSDLDKCALRGGSAGGGDDSTFLVCGRPADFPVTGTHLTATRNFGAKDIGFRCCANPQIR